MYSNIIKLDNINNENLSEILNVWESAVKSTHDFLSEEDFISIKHELREFMPTLRNMYCYLDDEKQIRAFIFVDNGNIEMLFVHNDLRGKGVGKKLINYAIEKLNATKVDVNEENKQGIGFYKHMGFKVIDRSELDNAGRNYPILHMELEK